MDIPKGCKVEVFYRLDLQGDFIQAHFSSVMEKQASDKEFTSGNEAKPTNIEKYLKVSFYHKEAKNSPSIMYIYKSRDYTEEKYFYFEQPYTGVFKIKKDKLKNINWLND